MDCLQNTIAAMGAKEQELVNVAGEHKVHSTTKYIMTYFCVLQKMVCYLTQQ